MRVAITRFVKRPSDFVRSKGGNSLPIGHALGPQADLGEIRNQARALRAEVDAATHRPVRL